MFNHRGILKSTLNCLPPKATTNKGAITWSHELPQAMLIVVSRMTNTFEHVVYLFLVFFLRWTPSHIPLKYMCPNIFNN
jgi:hypothetical protein